MSTFVTGRTLDADGEPIAGTGFEVEPGSDLAALLAERAGPLTSHPERATWSAALDRPDGVDGTARAVSVLGPGYRGPPEHRHEESEEIFEVRRGEVAFELDGVERLVGAGERVTVPTGVRHTFRPASTTPAVMVTEISPAGRVWYLLPTLSGLAHDRAADADPLQRALVAERLAGDTVFTGTVPRLLGPVTGPAAVLARLRGYQGAYERYRRASFWRRHVEQPAHGPGPE